MDGKVDYYYERVIPRDLFNEAKLLKCLGRLALLAHDKIIDLDVLNAHKYVSNPSFKIALHEYGYLTCGSIQFFTIRNKNIDKKLWLGTTYNSKANYPMICYDHKLGEIMVFTEEGELTEEFKDYIK